VQALRGEPITLYGDGSQTRSFCYVDDLVAGLVALMEQDETPGPVNLGNPDEVTIRGLAERILALAGSTAGVVFRPLPEDDPARRCPDISLARRLLGWEPATSLDAGLARTVEWFRENLPG
jgi:UDP-glucuronate decarboxylase